MVSSSSITVQKVLQSGRCIVVPGDAAALQLRAKHDQNQREAGATAWSPANVLTWKQWLRSLWSKSITDGLETRLLLNPTQEHAVWRDVIARHRDRDTAHLTSVEALANLAESAWKLSEAYGATYRLRQYATTQDARVFADWAEDFAETCHREGLLSEASLDEAIADRLRSSEIKASETFVFAGFATWTPAQRIVLGAMAAGHDVLEVDLVAEREPDSKDCVLEAASEGDELLAAARWIRSFILQRAAQGLPYHVGAFVNDLDACQAQVAAAFRSVLAPEAQNVLAADMGSPFNLVGPESLASHPMVAVALDLASWAAMPLPRDSVSALLLSPYVTADEIHETAVSFDVRVLRATRLLRPEVSLQWFRDEIWRDQKTTTITWPESLHRYIQSGDRLNRQRPFTYWVEFIRGLIRVTGWPSKTLDAHESLVAETWQHVLDTVATLDFRGLRATYAQVMQALHREAMGTMIPSLHRNAPVQILTPTSAVGTTFDAVVFVRATDNNWPNLPSANALIGWPLQAKLGMPGTDRTAALLEAREFLEHIKKACGQILFSYAVSAGDTEQRLSPLIAELQLPLHVSPAETDADVVHAEVVADIQPIPALLSSFVHGGASVLQHQAACGFRAFAEIRLRSRDLEARDIGHDAGERGNMTHFVLQKFWEKVKTRKALSLMAIDDRRKILGKFADEFLAKQPAVAVEQWDSAYLAIQRTRLVRVLNNWLDYELKRADFEVQQMEKAELLHIGPLQLQVRLDRVDLVDDGEVFVDYKTGSYATVADWDGDRPDQPQLPLYAMLDRERALAGLAFAKVRPGRMGWQGYATSQNVLPGKNTVRDLDLLREEWHGTLTALAESFAAGDIRVDPKSYPVTCTHCAQRLLCRLDAATLLELEDSDVDDGEDAGA